MNYIVSVDKNWGIGKENRLLFSLPTDMKFFRSMTLGKTVIMGRKTLQSLPNGAPLKNRENIVLTRDERFKADGCTICHSLGQLAETLRDKNTDEIFVIGGAAIYNLLYNYCKFAYITKVDAVSDADTFIENLDCDANWKAVSEGDPIEENGLVFRFVTYENSQVKIF